MTKNFFKSKTFIIIIAAVLIAGIGFTAGMMTRTSLAEGGSSDYIGADRAKQIALENAGVTDKNATFTKVEIDRYNNTPYYELAFFTAAAEYEFEINAQNGSVAHKQSRDLVSKNNLIAPPSPKTDQTQTQTQTQPQAQTRQGNSAHHRENDMHHDGVHEYIGVSEAKRIALHHAGAAANDVSFTGAKLDSNDGIDVYEIEFTCNGMAHEYDIHAQNGKILSHDSESAEFDD